MRSGSTIALLLFLPSAAAAQTADEIPLLTAEWSTRALGLGDAFVLHSDDADAIFYNPATLSDNAGMGLAVRRNGTHRTAVQASAATDWADGALAIGVRSLGWHVPGDAEPSSPGIQPASASALAVSLGYATDVWGDNGVRIGAAATILEQRAAFDEGVTAAFDVGIAREVGPFTLGLSARSLGPSMDLSGKDIELPRHFTFGATTQQEPLGPLDVLASAAISRRYDGELIPGAGLEVSWWPIIGRTFIGRIGARRVTIDSASPLTLGAGFAGDKLAIDYAFQDLGGAGAIHRLGLSWR